MHLLQLSERFNRYVSVKKAVAALQPLPKVVHEVFKPKPKVIPKPVPKPVPKPEREGVTWFAMHQGVRESISDVVESLLHAATQEGVLFRHVDMLGTFTIGRHLFVRLRVDTLKLTKVLRRLWREDRRSTVSAGSSGFMVTLPDGRMGKVPASTIHMLPPMGQQQQFTGNKIKRWELQFPGK